MEWLRTHTYQVHLLGFFLMVFPPIGLYFSVQAGALALTWLLLGLVVLGNALVLFVKG
jgi:membrane protein YqaA with SNARE-associated domain